MSFAVTGHCSGGSGASRAKFWSLDTVTLVVENVQEVKYSFISFAGLINFPKFDHTISI